MCFLLNKRSLGISTLSEIVCNLEHFEVSRLIVCLVEIEFKEFLELILVCEDLLGSIVDDESTHTERVASDVHVRGQRLSAEEHVKRQELNDNPLEHKFTTEHKDEQHVV